ncbi:methyl-accepting chemotaxis protein [Methylorubrum salsuginis]|uniref:Methyl-accepting chemotaxis protein n=1 Tax=Methylorubrum salsuginis TaxID=414703 RepID=A0A1I4G910_9HYPH|nr:HAMP domain-containing methyl-accepting chemotaxis protein [Methylorubrum salsuginis]SFL26053.1 Methyl-accepting chemotaxis protein [Methylorubrum salsuginis]
MRITLGHKLAVVVGLLGFVAVGISAFALSQSEQARQRAAATEAVWDAALQARTLAHAIEHAVVQATSLYTAGDTEEAKTHLAALQEALAEVEQARGPFLATADAQLTPERKRRLDLAVKEFLAYQTETAEMGLTVSPKAALIQATDEATVKNRERMVTEINRVGREVLAHLDVQRHAAAAAERQATLTLIGAPALALVIGLAAAFWIIATQVQRPLDRLRATMRDLAAARLDLSVPFTGRRDEVGEMARAIEAFRADLIEKRTLDAEAEARNTRDAARARHLAGATQAFEAETGRTVADLARFAATMQGAADALSEVAGDTTAQAVRVAAASNQSAGLVHGVASAAEELSSSARVIEERVRHTSEIATLAMTDTQRLESVVASLSRAASEIDLVVTLIRNVAEQTNLLALNATIEAARAGPAGRGFAVVAAEVKELAGQTAAATDRITGQVAAIQSAADGTVSAIGSIGHTIAQMSEIAADVAVAAEQQGQASQEIASAIAKAAADVRTVSESIGRVQEAAASSEARADQVRDSALQVNAGSHGLRIAIEAFLGRVHAA